MMNLTTIDLRDDNLMLTRELLAAGYDDKVITRLVRNGVFFRLRHGAYTYQAHWSQLGPRERRRLMALAVARAAKAPCVLAGPSAADEFDDVPVWDLGDDVHLARLDRRAERREAGRVIHRGLLVAEDITIRNGRPVTSGTKTALDVMTISDTEHALVVVDGLLRTGETTMDLLERRSVAMSQDPHSLNFPIVLQRADGRHESAGETRMDWTMHRLGLPAPVPQFEIVDGRGRVIARVDFAWPELGVFMEFDGKEKYLRHRRPGESVADAVLREKAREQLVCGVTGWRCVRTVWADLYHPERTGGRIVATFEGRPWAA
jgi:hypothetical protein